MKENAVAVNEVVVACLPYALCKSPLSSEHIVQQWSCSGQGNGYQWRIVKVAVVLTKVSVDFFKEVLAPLSRADGMN
jgi:hypothetical protein